MTAIRCYLLSLFFFLGLIAITACTSGPSDKEPASTQTPSTVNKQSLDEPRTRAPELTTNSGWVNTESSYTLKDFKGKVVLLDFWTYGCINCQHIVPDYRKVRERVWRQAGGYWCAFGQVFF